MKHIIFGGFDYPILYEMDQNSILNGIDYFVDVDQKYIGSTYLGKIVYPIDVLNEEDMNNALILIGSIVYKTEYELILREMGMKEGTQYQWAISFIGDKECPRLWKHIEWSDKEKNANNLQVSEFGESALSRMRVAASMIRDWSEFDTVVDLGAEHERLREVIPSGIRYVPVDYVKYSDNTILCNLNKYEFPPETYSGNKTCVFSLGNIYYVSDWKWYLEKIAGYCDCTIIGHHDFVRISREYRRTNWTRYNALFDHEIIRHMQSLGFILTDSLDFRLKTTLYKFEKVTK